MANENDTTRIAYNDRLLVISGGGARGAWGAGFAKYLTETVHQGSRYKIGVGTSTGALMMPFVLTGRFDELHTAYTTVTQDDVFRANPFNDEGKLNARAIERAVTLHKTFGDTTNLKDLINRRLTPDLFAEIKSNPQLDFGIHVLDFRTAAPDTKFFKQLADREALVEWIWASSNQPLLMSYTEIDGGYYVDGGVSNTIPILEGIHYAVQHGIRAVDVIVNETNLPKISKEFEPHNVYNGLLRLVEIWRGVISADDALIGMLAAQTQAYNLKSGLELTIYYFPYGLSSGQASEDLLFNKERMEGFWKEEAAGHFDPPAIHGLKENKIIMDMDFLKIFFSNLGRKGEQLATLL